MTYSVKTIAYFAVWGLMYGVLLGAFSGTAILPYFGTIYATIWGGGIGLASGILSGILTAAIRARRFDHDTDLDGFRQFLSLTIGALVTIAAPIMLLLSTNGFLWGSGLLRDMMPWTSFSLFAASFWGGLSAAYTASHYSAFIAHLTARREYDEFEVEPSHARQEMSTAWNRLLRAGLNRWVFLTGAIAGGLINLLSGATSLSREPLMSLTQGLAYLGIGGILGILATFCLSLYVSFGNAALITFLKRLIFREHFSHLPAHWTRWILTLTAFLFTGAVTYWTMIFAPLIAFVTAFMVYRTLALPDETIDKAKRKEKNALALQVENDDENEILLNEDQLLEAHQR